MLTRPHLARGALRRHYHAKVRAVPFAFSAEDAISHIGVAASVAGFVGRSSKGPPNVSLSTLFTSMLAKYLPASGFRALRPTRIQPLYFPTWFVSAELEGTTWLSSESNPEESESDTVTVQFEDLYLPGFNMDMGRILIRDRPRQIELAKPYSPDLARQWGLDVMCLPFNILPFELLDKTRSLSYTDTVISENARFNPQSVKTNLAAAYPVLLPVYLVQYISKEPWPPVTIILAAHNDPGIHYIHIPHPNDGDNVRLPFEELVAGQDDYIEVGSTSDDADITAMVVSRPPNDPLSSDLSQWLNDRFQQRNAPVSMAAKDPIDMEDPRIREWTREELDPVHNWLEVCRARSFFRNTILKTMNLDESKITITQMDSIRGQPKFPGDLVKAFLKPELEWQKARAASTPEWWRRWAESQKPRQPIR